MADNNFYNFTLEEIEFSAEYYRERNEKALNSQIEEEINIITNSSITNKRDGKWKHFTMI